MVFAGSQHQIANIKSHQFHQTGVARIALLRVKRVCAIAASVELGSAVTLRAKGGCNHRDRALLGLLCIRRISAGQRDIAIRVFVKNRKRANRHQVGGRDCAIGRDDTNCRIDFWENDRMCRLSRQRYPHEAFGFILSPQDTDRQRAVCQTFSRLPGKRAWGQISAYRGADTVKVRAAPTKNQSPLAR